MEHCALQMAGCQKHPEVQYLGKPLCDACWSRVAEDNLRIANRALKKLGLPLRKPFEPAITEVATAEADHEDEQLGEPQREATMRQPCALCNIPTDRVCLGCSHFVCRGCDSFEPLLQHELEAHVTSGEEY